jgi:hypothetical protein
LLALDEVSGRFEPVAAVRAHRAAVATQERDLFSITQFLDREAPCRDARGSRFKIL